MPGTVQAANYDTGGQGVAYNVTSANGSANSYRSDGVDLEATADTQDTTDALHIDNAAGAADPGISRETGLRPCAPTGGRHPAKTGKAKQIFSNGPVRLFFGPLTRVIVCRTGRLRAPTRPLPG